MNDRRFIELLNLYVDQELSDDDARELEQEIAQRPDRRKVYSQYCRMQRACVRLLEQQEAPAPRLARITHAAALEAEDTEPATILPLPVSRSRQVRRGGLGWVGWGGSALAAAACVAVALVVWRQPADMPSGPMIAVTPVPAIAAPETVAPQAVTVDAPALASATPAPAYRPALSVNALLRSNDGRFAQTGIGLSLDQSSLDWQQQLRLTPLRQMPFEPSPFQSGGGLRAAEAGASSGDRMDQPVPAHLITFEFRR